MRPKIKDLPPTKSKFTLTEEELETAARKLCELRGIDPDKRVGDEIFDVDICPLAWETVIDEIKNHYQIMASIYFAIKENG